MGCVHAYLEHLQPPRHLPRNGGELAVRDEVEVQRVRDDALYGKRMYDFRGTTTSTAMSKGPPDATLAVQGGVTNDTFAGRGTGATRCSCLHAQWS